MKYINTLQKQLGEANVYLINCSDEELHYRYAPGKWSKKEILGHLIDSAINNLQRFTEVQYEEKPYRLRPYKQNELVIANRYQEAELQDLIDLWLCLNKRIEDVWRAQTAETLAYEIVIGDQQTVTLEFWINDYVEHMAHHLKAIMGER